MTEIVDKIRKLLALARDKGASENEAAVALAMAQRLMLQHDIKNVEEKREVHAVMGDWMEVDRGELWEMYVAQAVAKLFNCRCAARPSTGAHQFVGKPESVEVCGDTFLWVCGQVEVLYKEALCVRRRGMSVRERGEFRKTFKQGCATRVYDRACDIVAKARNDIPEHVALVVVDQSLAAADDLIKSRGYSSGRARKPSYGSGTAAGMAAGDRVQLQDAVRANPKMIGRA